MHENAVDLVFAKDNVVTGFHSIDHYRAHLICQLIYAYWILPSS